MLNQIHTHPRLVLQKIVCVILCICLAFGAFLLALHQRPAEQVEAARTSKNVDEDIVECEALLSRLQSELKELTGQISDLEDQSNTAAEQAQLIAGQVAVLEAQIELNESLLQSCDMKLSTTQAERILVESEYEYYQEMFGELMRFIYENGTVSDFELLFTSASLSDYLERRDNFNSIMDCISDLTKSMEQSMLHLHDLEEEYEEAQTKYSLYLVELAEEDFALKEAKANFEALANEVGKQQSVLSGSYAELSQTIQETKGKLETLKKERATLIALEEEERKKQEEQNRPSIQKPGTVSDLGFAWPLERGISYRITSYFATRTNPITGYGTEFHQGLDIACAKGTQILAAKAGIVTKSAEYGGYGKCVIIYHGKDSKGRSVTTLYGHASELKCSVNDQVEQGQCVSLVGSTGRSTGNHLHFSVLLDGEYVDPDDYLPDGFYTKLPNS